MGWNVSSRPTLNPCSTRPENRGLDSVISQIITHSPILILLTLGGEEERIDQNQNFIKQKIIFSLGCTDKKKIDRIHNYHIKLFTFVIICYCHLQVLAANDLLAFAWSWVMGRRKRVLLPISSRVLGVAPISASTSITRENECLCPGKVVKSQRQGWESWSSAGLVRFSQTGLGRGEAGRCWFQGNRTSETGMSSRIRIVRQPHEPRTPNRIKPHQFAHQSIPQCLAQRRCLSEFKFPQKQLLRQRLQHVWAIVGGITWEQGRETG